METKEKLARDYIGMSRTVNIDEEERYYNSKIKEYDAFKRGYEAAQLQLEDKIREAYNIGFNDMYQNLEYSADHCIEVLKR